MKKTTQKLLLAAVIVLAASSSVSAQVTASATATATIITPITLVEKVNMNFGNVSVSGTAGTVVLPAAAGIPTRTTTGGVTLPTTASGGTIAAAEFDVAGEIAYTYAITIPSTALTLTSGANTMTITAFTNSVGTTGLLDGSGKQIIYVGATLNVGANQGAGTYVSGTPFDVTVNYN